MLEERFFGITCGDWELDTKGHKGASLGTEGHRGSPSVIGGIPQRETIIVAPGETWGWDAMERNTTPEVVEQKVIIAKNML